MRRLLDPYVRFRVVGRITRRWWRWRFAHFGARSLFYRPAWLLRPEMMSIGDDVWIAQDAWLEVDPSVRPGSPTLRVGNGVVMRHHVTISAMESVTIEDDVLIAAFTSIYDNDHTLGERGNAIWYPMRTAPVRIGRGTWLGERVAVLRGADIGHHCIIGANSVVKGSIPDHSIAVGAPARVVGSTHEQVHGTPAAA
jgi:acetyltransferase-like isoleucine patch superfamily enzyme